VGWIRIRQGSGGVRLRGSGRFSRRGPGLLGPPAAALLPNGGKRGSRLGRTVRLEENSKPVHDHVLGCFEEVTTIPYDDYKSKLVEDLIPQEVYRLISPGNRLRGLRG
jgi:hypothetical protein